MESLSLFDLQEVMAYQCKLIERMRESAKPANLQAFVY